MKNKPPMIKANSKNESADLKRVNTLYARVLNHIDRARQAIQRSIDTEMVKAYWLIGQEIVVEEQCGQARAEYGKTLLSSLASKLQKKYNKGFGVDTLEQARKFYLTYQKDNNKKWRCCANQPIESIND